MKWSLLFAQLHTCIFSGFCKRILQSKLRFLTPQIYGIRATLHILDSICYSVYCCILIQRLYFNQKNVYLSHNLLLFHWNTAIKFAYNLFFKVYSSLQFLALHNLCSASSNSKICNLSPITANLEQVLCYVAAFTTPLTNVTYSMYLLILQQIEKKAKVQTQILQGSHSKPKFQLEFLNNI